MKTILSLLLLFSQTTFATQNYYFDAVSGDDAASVNSITTPWQTLTKLNAVFSGFNPGDSVLLKRGGTFYGTLVINKSGSVALPIVIGAYGTGKDPVVTGLVSLTWISAGNDLWRSNEALGLKSLNMVVADGVPAGMGRWPNLDNGNGGYDSIRSSTSRTITDEIGLTTAPSPGKPAYFIGAEIVVRTQRWLLDRHPITDYNSNTSTIEFDPSSSNENPKNNLGYFIQDDSTVLDKQNEWWYNRTNGQLKMYSAGSPENVSAANLESLLISSGESYITVGNITFYGCNEDAVSFGGGSTIVIQNCTIQNTGRNAINTATPYCSFLNNTITDAMSKGVSIKLYAEHTTIKYNTIRNVGQVPGLGTSQSEDAQSGDGVYVKEANATIEYNSFIKMGYAAVHLTRVDSAIIRYNYIDTVCNVYDDGGAIYIHTGEAYKNYGRQISNNIILHGIGAFYGSGVDGGSAAGAGVAGIYNDRGSSDMVEEFNTIAYFEKGILGNYGCTRNKISHNTLFNNGRGIQLNTRLDDKTRALTITRNIVFAVSPSQTTLSIYSDDGDKINTFGTIDTNYYARPVKDKATMSWQNNSTAEVHNVSLSDWQDEYPAYDVKSKKAPRQIADTSQIKFEYNATNTDKTISLNGYNYIDLDSVTYSQDIVLKPYTSIVLISDTGDAVIDTNVVLNPLADACIRDGFHGDNNYGTDAKLYVKTTAEELNVISYLKFSLGDLSSGVQSARLRIYGKNNPAGRGTEVNFNSRENVRNPPKLIITTYASAGKQPPANYGRNNASLAKSSGEAGINGFPYTEFPVPTIANTYSSTPGINGANTDEATIMNISVSGTNDTWTESGITWKNAPGASTFALDTKPVTKLQFYEFDVTAFVKDQYARDKVVSFILKTAGNSNKDVTNKKISFHDKEKIKNTPQLTPGHRNSASTPWDMSSGSDSKTVALISTSKELTHYLLDKALLRANVYPNPIQKSFILSFPTNYYGDFSLQIIDQAGRIWDLGKQKLPSVVPFIKIEIERLSLSPGMYYLKIFSETRKTEVIKLMVK